jgi:hypothetical protein
MATRKLDLGTDDVHVPSATRSKTRKRGTKQNSKAQPATAAPAFRAGSGKGLRLRIGADGTVNVRHMTEAEACIAVLPSQPIELE